MLPEKGKDLKLKLKVMEKKKINWEEVKELIPARVSLYYVDYNDSLDESTEVLQHCIHTGNMDPLWEKVDSCYWECDDVLGHFIQELRDDLISKFDISDDEADELLEEFEDEIRDTLYDRDDSNVVEDLLRNTRKQTMFFDTGYEVPGDSWSWTEKEVAKERQVIKRKLGLRALSKEQDAELDMMIRQASYGGRLVLYFYDNVEDYIDIKDGFTSINFCDPNIAIIDTCGGSGDHCGLVGVTVKQPLDVENIFICKEIKYSYTHDVCGMYSDWCEGTSVSFTKEKSKKVAKKSSLNAHIDREKMLNAVFSAGGCTAGDMDINRHRSAFYVNHYPCGSRCKDCGTFWID